MTDADDEVTTGLLDLPDHIIVENILPELFPSSLSDDEPNAKDLRDILSFASTCTRIHALASHPSLWRGVNAAVFSRLFGRHLRHRGVAPPPLPLGAVHCGALRLSMFDRSDVALLEALPDLTDIHVESFTVGSTARESIRRAISALARLSRLELAFDTGMHLLAGAELSSARRLESLAISGGADYIEGVFECNHFSSLRKLDIGLDSSDSRFVSRAVIRACPNLEDVTVSGPRSGSDAITIASGCAGLRRLTVGISVDIGEHNSTAPAAPNLRELVVFAFERMISGSFLLLFPNLTELELRDKPFVNEGTLAAIGGMADLKHLKLEGGGFSGDACRKLLTLARHPSAMGRQSLTTLVLKDFGDDLGEFLSSRWCSHLTELELMDCDLSQALLDSLCKAHIGTLSRTLRSLNIGCEGTECSGVGRFVAGLSSLKSLSIGAVSDSFDGNDFLREIGPCAMRLSSLHFVLFGNDTLVDVMPVLPVLSEAVEVSIYGNVTQHSANAIAASCPRLKELEITSKYRIHRPSQLQRSCTFSYITI